MNAVMTFPVILLIWLGLTVVAAIAGSIAHRFPRTLGKESRTALGHCYTAPGGSWCVRLAVACWRAPRERTATAMRLSGSRCTSMGPHRCRELA